LLPALKANNANQKTTTNQDTSWSSNQIILNNMIQSVKLKKFLQWPVIKQTMFFNNRDICNIEYDSLISSTIWDNVWKKNIYESYFGYPLRYLKMLNTSCNSIHHAYHLDKFFQSVSFSKINEIDLIFEFGGGYGNLCRILYNIGYTNEYWLFDLPEFSNLQEYYLSNTISGKINEISFISELDELERRKNYLQNKNVLFIATWSLSESPISIREKVLDIFIDSNYYLIAYQKKFADIDNEKYFSTLSNKQKTIWKKEIINHLPDSSYLIGKPFQE
jgi:putative sugar O-methyltransferase